MLVQYADFFNNIESSPLNPAQARAVVNGEHSLLVLAGAGSGKTSVLVARAGWLMTTGEAAADQILLLAFGRKAAQEMDERIQELTVLRKSLEECIGCGCLSLQACPLRNDHDCLAAQGAGPHFR